MQKISIFFVYFFQFPDSEAPLGKKTLAILMTYTSSTLNGVVQTVLPSFLQENRGWCKEMCSFVLKRKNQKFKDFTNEYPEYAFNTSSISIWARCYSRHVAVFFNFNYWCTRKDKDLKKCDIFLIYRGGNCFEDSRPMNTKEFVENTAKLARVQALVDERDLLRSQQNMQKVDQMSSDSSDRDTDLDLEEV